MAKHFGLAGIHHMKCYFTTDGQKSYTEFILQDKSAHIEHKGMLSFDKITLVNPSSSLDTKYGLFQKRVALCWASIP